MVDQWMQSCSDYFHKVGYLQSPHAFGEASFTAVSMARVQKILARAKRLALFQRGGCDWAWTCYTENEGFFSCQLCYLFSICIQLQITISTFAIDLMVFNTPSVFDSNSKTTVDTDLEVGTFASLPTALTTLTMTKELNRARRKKKKKS